VENSSSSTMGNTSGSGSEAPLMDQAKEQTQQVVQQTKDAAGQLMGQAREQVMTQLTDKKTAAAGSLGTIAQAIRQTGQQLEGQDETVSRCAVQAADMIDGLTGYLREKEIDQLIGDIENVARRQPVLFLGSAFALGFMASRFLKSSSAPVRSEEMAYRPESRVDLTPIREQTVYQPATYTPAPSPDAYAAPAVGSYPTYGTTNAPLPTDAYATVDHSMDDTADDTVDTDLTYPSASTVQ